MQRYYDLLWQDVFDSEITWEAMESRQREEEISDDFYHQSLKEVAETFEKMSIEWWPCRGTLIALLRHGARSGELFSGRDVVERDIDVMLHVANEDDWYLIGRSIETSLLQKGWDRCWTKPSASSDSVGRLYRFSVRRDLLYCVKTEPAYMMLDVTSYMSTSDYIYVHRVCEADELSSCSFPRLGPLQHAIDARGAVLEKSAIHPMRKCLAKDHAVPCPNRPLDTIQAMRHSALRADCIALPDKPLQPKSETEESTGKERKGSTDRQAQDMRELREVGSFLRSFEKSQSKLLFLGLRMEDIEILRRRSANLDRMGFQSMSPYFGNCTFLRNE